MKALSIRQPRARLDLTTPEKQQLYSVWIDEDLGESGEPEWAENSVPKPLPDALEEAREARSGPSFFPAIVLPEEQLPSTPPGKITLMRPGR